MLTNTKGRGKNKRNNILNDLNNIESSVFKGLYFPYNDESLESEESIAERTKLRRQRPDKIAKKEKMIYHKLFKEYFNCSSPSDMYKNLNKTTNTVNNKVRVNMIKNNLASLIEKFKSNSASNAKKKKKKKKKIKEEKKL